jgi:sulfur carrier protein ThiS
MRTPRLTLWLSLLSVAVILLAGCAPRAGSGQTVAEAGPDALAIDLPALVIDFDAQGQPSIGNVPLAQLGDMLPAAMLQSLAMPTAQVTFMTESNIQHVQIDNTPSGLLLLVNGRPIPSLRWDGEILSATAETLEVLGVGVPALENVLPLVSNIGLGVILRFPIAEGQEALPTYIEESPAALAAQQAQADFLADVGAPPKINLRVAYDAEGGWRVGDLTDTEWTNLTGVPWSALRLQPNMIQGLISSNITEVTLSTDASGIHIAVNGNALPYIGWADGELNHLIDLAGQMGLWDTLADSGMNMGEIVGMVQTLLPVVQASETNISVSFPEAVASAQ